MRSIFGSIPNSFGGIIPINLMRNERLGDLVHPLPGIDLNTATGCLISQSLERSNMKPDVSYTDMNGDRHEIYIQKSIGTTNLSYEVMVLPATLSPPASSNIKVNCKICEDTGEIPYANYTDTPSENKRPCAACKIKPI